MRVLVAKKPEDIPEAAIDGKPTYGYWNIIGLAEPARLALVAAGVDSVDIRVDPGDMAAGTYRQTWLEAKKGLYDVLNFPNLPFYFDDKVALTQSDAILRHLGRKYDLMGDAGQEHITDLALDEVKDYESSLAAASYGQGPDAVAAWYENMPPKIAAWKTLLGTKEYLTGSKVSVADFKLYTFLCKLNAIHEQLSDRGLSPPPKSIAELDAYMKRIENIPAIKTYMESEDYMKRPLNNPSAKFNN